MDRTIYDPDRESEHLDALVSWVKNQSSRAEAVRILSDASGIQINYKSFSRVVTQRRWDREGLVRAGWLAFSDSAASDTGPDASAEVEVTEDAGPEEPPGDATQRNFSDDEVESAGGDDAGAQIEETTDEDKPLPEGMELEDMVAVIDARREEDSGEKEGGGWSSAGYENIAWAKQQVAQATTKEEIAAYAAAPALKEVPGLSLENARAAALLKLDGWDPTDPDRKPPGLHGDGPLLLFLGEDVSYEDDGARQLAFAAANEWGEESPYCAQQMRYAVSLDVRQRRYAVESHADRPEFVGYRKADWAPERPYVDSDHFFGSGGFQREDGVWMPSRAEVLAYLYHVRAIERALEGTAAEAENSPYLLSVRKTRMELEYMLLGDEYGMSLHYYRVGVTMRHSTRDSERKDLESEIVDLERRIRQSRRRLAVRRAVRATSSGLVAGVRQLLPRAKRQGCSATDLADPEYAGQDPKTGPPVQVQQEPYQTVLVTAADAVSLGAQTELVDVSETQDVENPVMGETEWQVLDPSWDRRDRTRWYEAGAGPLSAEAAAEADMLPAPGAPFVSDGPQESLLRIRPPRVGEFGVVGLESLLASLGEGHTLSLEVVGGGGEVELMVRTVHPGRVVDSMLLHFPGVQIERIMPEDDPLRLRDGEVAWRRILRPQGPEFLPLSVFDEGAEFASADPFLDVIGTVGQDLQEGERVGSRVVLRQKPHGWSEKWRLRALTGPGSENVQRMERERQEARNARAESEGTATGSGEDGAVSSLLGDPKSLLLVALVVLGIAGSIGTWVDSLLDSASRLEVIAYAVAGVAAAGLMGLLAWRLGAVDALMKRWKPDTSVYYDPEQVSIRISGGAYEFEVQAIVILGERDHRVRADRVLETVVNCYRGYDAPLGSRFDVEEGRLLVGSGQVANLPRRQRRKADVLGESLLQFGAESRRSGLMSRRPANGIVGSKEAASFWHLPPGSVEVPLVRRVQSRKLRPPASAVRGGALVGVSSDGDGGQRPVFLSDEVMSSHKFLIARTRMGKSTLMGHIGGEQMAAKARGESEDALIVIDPHAELVRDLLRRVPEELMGRVVLVDLDDEERTVGINLLDTHVFTDRDKAVQAIIEVAKGTWDNWGGRMEAILSSIMMCLYEANQTLSRRGQLTILDGKFMLSDANFRDAVLDRVKDPELVDWWQSAHGGWAREYSQEAVAPVINRLSSFARSKVVRAILGQRRCTVNLGDVIRRGDVLLVNTSQGSVGAEVAALVGVSILKLIDVVVTAQGSNTQEEQNEEEEPRRVSLIVDEMHTLQGVDFQGILSQIAKRGGVLTMATQSLASLDLVGETMREDILANTGLIAVFQCNAVDARRLLPELRSEYLDESDITGLPRYQCYVRLIGAEEVETSFTTEGLPPLQGDPRIERAQKYGTRRYARVSEQVLEELNAATEERVKNFRAQIRERRETRSRDERVDLRRYGRGRRGRGRAGAPEESDAE